MSIKSPNYKSPSCDSNLGNVNADVMTTGPLTGTEAADTVILLRRMSENNTYLRITAISDASMVGAVDIGYVSRETGESDSLDAFGDGLNIATANQSVIADVAAIGFKHDLALTIKTNNAANSGKEIKMLVEFVNTSG